MREVKPTQKPVPSSDIKDLFFNSGLLDIWSTSLETKYIDRFGNCHLTAAGMEWLFKELVEKFKIDMNTAIVAAGYITIDSFQQGADLPNNELTQRNHILRDETTGEYCRWDGDLPKQVPAGSTPQSTGGIGKGAWVSVGDASLRSDIGYVIKEYRNTVEMKSDEHVAVGAIVKTLGYYSAEDGGGATYINRGVGWPQVADGFINHAGTSGNFLELQFSERLNYLQAGGVADWNPDTQSGTDNTPILQNAINFMYPFEWKGSVASTNASLISYKGSIFIPEGKGKYMLGSQVLLNPYTSLIGVDVPKSFGMDLFSQKTVGSFFVPKFTDWNKYVFDVAPYDENGQRVTDTSIAFTNADNDQAKYTRVYGIKIMNITVCPDHRTFNSAAGDIPFSPLRLFGSTSSSIKNNFFAQFLHGPSLQACWDYDYDRNLVQTFDSALSIYEGTTGNIGGINYCNKLGDRRRYGLTVPSWWPKKDDKTFIDNDYNVPSSLVVVNVKNGKSNIGTWIQEKYNRSIIGEGANFQIGMLHSESIDASLVALKDCTVRFLNGKTFLPSNRLFRPISRLGSGSTVTFDNFDFGCCGPLASYIENGVSVNLLEGCIASDAANGTANQGIVQTTLYTVRNDNQGTPSVYYQKMDRRPVRDIYVNVLGSGLGSNDYYGYDDNSAMITVGAALKRVNEGDNAVIRIRNGATSTTSEIITDTPTVSNASVLLSERFADRPHTITGTISLNSSNLEFGGKLIFNGGTVFDVRGTVNIIMGGQSIINTNGVVFSAGSNIAASVTLMKQGSSAFSTSGALSSNSARMSVNMINASTNSVLPAGGWGTNTKVI